MPVENGATVFSKKTPSILRIVAAAVIFGLLAAVIIGGWLLSELRGSLPQLDGAIQTGGLLKKVVIERDGLGVPIIRAENRQDAAYALGFVHAQDRFFQMDGMRRYAAGEMSELVGTVALSEDRKTRLHRFRMRARRQVDLLSQQTRSLLEAYTRGVNSGLASLDSPPFEYAVLQLEPKEWCPEDSLLILYFMYLALQGRTPDLESTLGVMRDTLPGPLFRFLAPKCTEWDAPLVGEPCQPVTMPGVGFLSETTFGSEREKVGPRFSGLMSMGAGSNNWAVSGKLTVHGGALLANDMHLGMYVPNTWYRASLVLSDALLTGVTLPGGPAIVAGSNTKIAWGFTNSSGDWADLVILEPGLSDSGYLTPEGPRKYDRHLETIRVRFGKDESFEILSTVWGPVYDFDHRCRPRALRWVAHDSVAVNLSLLDLEKATTVEEALETANRFGIPAQNFTVVDSAGNIGWTLAGPIPGRYGHSGRTPRSWADGSCGWQGWLAPEENPRVMNPENGIIWTANARVVTGDGLSKIGDGGYRFAARARQIRDRLLSLRLPSERDMLDLQLDDRALYMKLWQQVLLQVLTTESLRGAPHRGVLRGYVEKWEGCASADSVGYRIIRLFHDLLAEEIFAWLLAPCREADARIDFSLMQDREAPLYRMVSERPPDLLHPGYSSWSEQLVAAVDRVAAELTRNGQELGERNWGECNTVQSHHPFSLAFPRLGRWLDMPSYPLPGDRFLPRVQTPLNGASERLVVSPGREEQGIFHMPCGQSGHPFSPHYRDGHLAWVSGEPTPFLAGPPIHSLVLVPADDGAGGVPTS